MINKLKIKNIEEYQSAYKHSITDPSDFWGTVASEFYWQNKWSKVLDWEFSTPRVEWFVGATLNITENIFERNFPDKKDQVALLWEPNSNSDQPLSFTYSELYERVNQCANGLKSLGVKKGDRVCIYLPMVPELAISVLACARIGAIHSVVFAGFSASSLSDRLNDAEASLVITSDGLKRGAKTMSLKDVVDEALITAPSVEKTLVVNVLNTPLSMVEGRDVRWDELVPKQDKVCAATPMLSEDPLFILYTSGSTGIN